MSFSTKKVNALTNVGTIQDGDVLVGERTSGTTVLMTYAASSGGVSDGDKGDISVSSSGTVWNINTPGVVTVATDDKVLIKDTSATDAYKYVTAQSIADLASSSPGGSNTQIQYNNAGSFGGISQLTYDGTNLSLTTGYTIDGTADEIQLLIQGHSTQTSNIFEIENSAASNLFTVNSSGNVTVAGTVDGRDIAADGTKLDTVESNATADQSDAEIKTAYENNADTNAFTDAEQTKLSGIEASADVTDETNVTDALDGATLTAATVAGTDKVLIQDADAADALKTVTAQSIADLAGGGAPGGSTTQVQYNNAGSFAGITGATTNGTALTLVAPILGTPASGDLQNCTAATTTTKGVASFATANFTVTSGAVSVKDNYLLNTGDVGTGVYDFGGASSFEIPNTSSPTVDATGELALNTTSKRLQYYDGSAVRDVVANERIGFKATKGSSQTLPNVTYTKVTFGTETFDYGGYYTGSRFTPLVAGLYQVSTQLGHTGADGVVFMAYIYKNAAQYSHGRIVSGGTSNCVVSHSDLVYLNGTTDYVEIYGWQFTGGNNDVLAGTPTLSQFAATLVLRE